ncbi:hypothetical protein EIB96_14275 [Vibrio parahaemolyticus]|nr:hypothetical protein [Vibrio parahaemolyticus]EGR1949105.1 hypothetical protein [Vibrio parahaemolyticus]
MSTTGQTFTSLFRILSSTELSRAYNALLRGEQRNTEVAAYHLNHLNQRIVKMPRVANPS